MSVKTFYELMEPNDTGTLKTYHDIPIRIIRRKMQSNGVAFADEILWTIKWCEKSSIWRCSIIYLK